MRIALIGCGNIGSFIATEIDEERIKGSLTRVYDIDEENAIRLIGCLRNKPVIARDIKDLVEGVNIVVEAASQKAVRHYIPIALNAGVDVLIMSTGALLDTSLHEELMGLAEKNNCNIYIPSGAIGGLDALKAADNADVHEVVLTTIKPPKSLKNIKFLEDSGVDVESLSEETVLFEGSASEAVKLFPKNVNVSAILSLAGIGPVKTKVIVKCDPTSDKNIHEIIVKGDFGEFSSKTMNVPSPDNPGTSYLACLSAVQTLKQISEKIKIGT